MHLVIHRIIINCPIFNICLRVRSSSLHLDLSVARAGQYRLTPFLQHLQHRASLVYLPTHNSASMPATRRSAGGARSRGPPAKGQSTLTSFSSRVTKNVAKSAKKSIISPSITKIDPTQAPKQTKAEEVVVEEPEPIEVDEEEEEVQPEVAPEPEKSEAELRAEQITDAQIKKYWKTIEDQWTSPRLHQQGVSLSERVLRYFDVSSQYGPCIGTPRMKRWKRAERLGLNPPVEVLAVLLKEETKGNKVQRAHMDEILNSTAVGS